jgi:hypothetical protein
MARFIDKSMDYGSRGDLRDDLHCIRMIDWSNVEHIFKSTFKTGKV